MPDQGPNGHPYDFETEDDEVAVIINIDLDEITNLRGDSESAEDEGSAKGRHPTARRLLP